MSFVSEKEVAESDEPEIQQSIFRFNKKKNNMKKNAVDESEIIDGKLSKMNIVQQNSNKSSKR